MSTKLGVLFVYNWEHEKCPLYRVAGCLLPRVSNILKSIEKQSGLSELSVILWVSAVEGCPQLRGVHS